jgi:cytochrome P450
MTATDSTPDFAGLIQVPGFLDDPYPWLHAVRQTAPVLETPFAWVLTRYQDCAVAVRDQRLANDERLADNYGVTTQPREAEDIAMLFLDPPDHTRLRSLVSKAFTPRTVARLRARIEELVDERLAAVAERGADTMDVITELAYPLPVIIICELLGVPPDDHATFQGWSRALAAGVDPSPLLTPEQHDRFAQAELAFTDYFDQLLERRRQTPGDDLLSALIAVGEDGDRLSSTELKRLGMFLLVAGHETTVNLIGNGVLALLRNRDEMVRLQEDPRLDRQAVEELLRFDSPVQLTQRISRDDYEIGGVTIPKGQTVIPLLGAANRDPEAFAEPDRLDLRRDDAHRHLAFGGGHHYCLGAALARLEGQVAIGRLVRRFPDLDLAADPVRRQTMTLRGLDELLVTLE